MTRPHTSRLVTNSWSRRSGFTLIEVLVALGLSLVLVSAIYSAISLHWRYETAGRERIERAQISLAVLRLMTEDIGSVVFTVPSTTEEDDAAPTGTASTGASSSTAATNSTAGGSSTTSSATSTSTSLSGTNSQSTTPSTATSLGIVGTKDSLQLDVSRPTREDFVPEQTLNGPTSTASALPSLTDNVRVTWAMVTPSVAAIDAKGVRALTANPALARQMTDRLRQAVEAPDTGTKLPSALPPLDESSILAKEIVSLSFQYYDGYAWTEEWDSTTIERLPRAIEVTIGFLKLEHRKPGALNLPGSETVIPIKHVIIVPSSTPVSGDEL